MNGIGFIFLFLGFGVLPGFGLASELGDQQGRNLQPSPYFRHEQLTNRHLLAQGLTEQKKEPITPTQQENSVEDTEGTEPIQQVEVVDSENGETTGEARTQQHKTQWIFKVVNDYESKPDDVLTTLVIIAGNARLQGSVTGNVLVLGGNVELSQSAQVNGTLEIIGGQATGNIVGVANLQVSNRWQMVPAAVELVMHPHTFLGISKEANLRLTLVKLVLFLFMYLLVVFIFPKPINAVSGLLAHRPVGSILFSTLMLVVVPLIFVLLTISIVGVPFMLLGLSLLLPLAICGKAAIFLTLGNTLFSGRLKPLAVIFGYLLYFMATALPYIDWVTFLIVNTIGIGICLLSVISMMRPQDPRRNTSWADRV